MSPEVRNLAASVRDRLLNGAKQRGEVFHFVLVRYASERFLYRLGESRYRDRFILKGAMLYALWGGTEYRPTRDLDFTAYGDSESRAVLECIREVCVLPVEDDALVFHSDTLSGEPIRETEEYDGIRIKFTAGLGDAVIPLQIDVGFGNAIMPAANDVEYPTLLDSPSPRIRAYPQEAVVAEKFHAMVVLGEINSRIKDFYDMFVLANGFEFGGQPLAASVAATFERRQTPVDAPLPVALTPRFYADEARSARWRTYIHRSSLPGAPADFAAVGELLGAFLTPVWNALAANRPFEQRWPPRGPWSASQ
ncbi:MAG: nucleotidyl transferase AbiEii/AbiGii toxin family protein [Chloroflexi bacterium]|nr:nucleotidyl transferase AbiEii/AbiGii toxin family protein [Chloroflexota bacterium]